MPNSKAVLVANAAIAVGLAKALEDCEEVEVREMDITELPDLTVDLYPQEVDIRPAKYHQVNNGHPRSYRGK